MYKVAANICYFFTKQMLFEYIVCQKGRQQRRCFPGPCFIVQEVGMDSVRALIWDRKACDRKVGSADSVPWLEQLF